MDIRIVFSIFAKRSKWFGWIPAYFFSIFTKKSHCPLLQGLFGFAKIPLGFLGRSRVGKKVKYGWRGVKKSILLF